MEVASRTQTKKREKETSGKFKTIVTVIILSVLSVIVLIPFIWMVSSSVKQNNQVFSIPIQWIPTEFHWDNYAKIWTTIPLLTFLRIQSF